VLVFHSFADTEPPNTTEVFDVLTLLQSMEMLKDVRTDRPTHDTRPIDRSMIVSASLIDC